MKNTAQKNGYPLLSDLHGSVPQRTWANNIRAKKMSELAEFIETLDLSTAPYEAENNEFIKSIGRNEKMALKFLSKVESAAFWIETRNLPTVIIFRQYEQEDLVGTAIKFIKDARKPPETLNGTDERELRKYFGADYRVWFADNKFDTNNENL